MTKPLRVTARLLPDCISFTARGRDAPWCLLELVNAGAKGCTPLIFPALGGLGTSA